MKVKMAGLWLGALLALGAADAQPQRGWGRGTIESPKMFNLELKLGTYKPLIDREAALNGAKPYEETFGGAPMLLGELEIDRQLWQQVGTLAVGFSFGYAEKYARATVVDDTGTITESAERTGFFVLPLRLLAVYRFDYAALHWGIPLVPYAKLALAYTPWWATKGSGVEYANGTRGAGGKWGYAFTGGISFLLDVLEPRLAKDFDTDMGVNHTYLFAEYVYEDVNNFGAAGLDLSSRRLAFGISFEF